MKQFTGIELALVYVVLVVTLGVWAVVGFIFWIPMLVRTTTSFSSVLLYATLFGKDPSDFGRPLVFATTFYIAGFKNIMNALLQTDRRSSAGGFSAFQWGRYLLEICWAGVFWYFLLYSLFSLGYVQWLPEMLSQWIARVSGSVGVLIDFLKGISPIAK